MNKEDMAYMIQKAIEHRTCKKCYWRNRAGCCTHPKVDDYVYEKNDGEDFIVPNGHEGGSIYVGDNFGCVHFKDDIKDENEKARYEQRTRK